VLQATYRIVGGRPVVHLLGKLETGQNFLVRDPRHRPYFYVARRDAARARELGARDQRPTVLITLDREEPVVRVQVAAPPDTPPLRDRLHGQGIRTYEADVRFAQRYLIDHKIKGAVAIRGEPIAEPPFSPELPPLLAYDQPQLSPCDWVPRLSVVSLDIETDLAAREVRSIALVGAGASEVLLLTPRGWRAPGGAIPFRSEKDLLAAFAHRIRKLDPDLLTGWNVIDFDLSVLARRAEELGVPLELGRLPGRLRLRPGRGRGPTEAQVPGRLVLDGIQLLRTSFIRLEDYSLGAAAQEILGEGKLLSGPDRGGDIDRAFRHDRERFVEYNRTDARLVLDLLDKLRLVDLVVERSLLTGLPPDRVAGSIAAFDALYLVELADRGRVAPTVGSGPELYAETAGGHVLDPAPGLYENVLVFDFQSLYPSLIRTFQIDPVGFVPAGLRGKSAPGELILSPTGAAFRREPGILPRLLDELAPRRKAAQRAGNAVASYAIKILMNSCYGVLATPACRFHNPEIANAITGYGRELLLWTKGRMEAHGHRVLYGDTDSLFVTSDATEPEAAWRRGEELAALLHGELAEHIRATWGVESKLVLELEHVFRKLFLPHLKGSGAGARKRYAGLAWKDGQETTVLTGLEAVRSDTTELAKQVQRELYDRLFHERPVEDYLARVVCELRAGRFDELLVYRKALRKDVASYTATTPPHVAAARKMSGKPGRRVAYVITRAGPEPAAERQHPYDYEHYVDKQVRPVAEPVLEILGLDFRKVCGDDRQLELF
jgi:DNA polymerase-2